MTASSPPAATARRPTALIAVAALAGFTANVDLSIVNLALPTIGRAFGTTQSELAWAVDAYILPYAVTILAIGRLGDRFGQRRVLVAGSLLFGLGSALCAFAPSYPVLLAGRLIQGPGGSALLTMGLAIVSANYSGADRSRALGLFFAAGASAAVVGPIVGGLLTAVGGWPAIFWTQIPLAALVAVAAMAVLPARPVGARRSLDLPALILGSLALLAVNIALLQGNAWGWTSPPILLAWAAAAVCVVAFVARERVASEPAVRLDVFRSRIYVASIFVGGAAWFGIVSGLVHLATYLQGSRGLDPFASAIVIAPWPLIALFVFPRAGSIIAWIGPERSMAISLAIAAIAAGAMVAFDRATPLPVVAAVAALGGVPLALGVTASTVCALAEFSPAEAGIASGVFNSLRQVGSSIGVALPAAAFDVGLSVNSSADPLVGSMWAFASRALWFTATFLLVIAILPREHAVVMSQEVAA